MVRKCVVCCCPSDNKNNVTQNNQTLQESQNSQQNSKDSESKEQENEVNEVTQDWTQKVNENEMPEKSEEEKVEKADENLPLSSTLTSQILIVYFLRKFLPYELVDLFPLLQNHGNPSDWIYLCPSCLETIRTAQALDIKLNKLRNKIEKLVLQTTNNNEFNDDDQLFYSIRNVIRIKKTRIKEEKVDESYDDFPVVYPIVKMEEEKRQSGDDLDFLMDDILSPDIQIDTQNQNQIQVKRGRGRPKGRRDTYARSRPGETAESKLRRRMCPVCGRLFEKSSQMSRHLNSVHKRKAYECPTCNMKFNRKDYFIKHKATHSYTPKITHFRHVTEDDFHFQPDTFLERDDSHQGIISPELDSEYVESSSEDNDDDNDSDFAVKTLQKKKVGRPRGSKTKKEIRRSVGRPRKCLEEKTRKSPLEQRTCPICNEVFRCYSKMTRHLNTKHERNPQFTCEICQKGFLRKDYLKSHMQTHLSHEEKLLLQAIKDKRNEADEGELNESGTEKSRAKLEERTCPVCAKVFEKPSVMKLHLDCVHNNVEAYMCEICSKKFKRKDSLRKHLKIHSEGDEQTRSFKCTFEGCDKGFRRKRDLEVHFRRHSGAKDLLCSLCGMSFRHEWSFKRHNILVHHHRPSKKYECDACGKIFKIKWHLDQHLKSKSHGGAGLGKRVRRKKVVTENQELPNANSTQNSANILPNNANNVQNPVFPLLLSQSQLGNNSVNNSVASPPAVSPIPNSPVTPASSIETEEMHPSINTAAELLHHNFWQYQQNNLHHHHHHPHHPNAPHLHNRHIEHDSSSSQSSHQSYHHRDLINYPFSFFTGGAGGTTSNNNQN